MIELYAFRHKLYKNFTQIHKKYPRMHTLCIYSKIYIAKNSKKIRKNPTEKDRDQVGYNI
jgi:hypothetical protein